MADSIAAGGPAGAAGGAAPATSAGRPSRETPEALGEAAHEARGGTLERLGSFRITYASIFVFLVLYLLTVQLASSVLQVHFEDAVRAATRVSPAAGPIETQIQHRVSDVVQHSPWVRWGGVRVRVTVLGADGRTPLYVGGGKAVPPPPADDFDAAMREAVRLLPAISDVFVQVPHGSVLSVGILMVYGAVLLQVLFVFNRRLARQEAERLALAAGARDDAAQRARSIEHELAAVRERLEKVEPAERERAQEIDTLQAERSALQRKLREVAEREAELRASAERASELDEERRALEELLEEALEDVEHKEGEIANLQQSLKSVARKPKSGGRTREVERLERRLRTLYKGLECDDRAIADLAALGDETLRLRAEEGLKRLDDDPDTAAVRRKVGGLPPQLSIYELGFAGKGRIYYTRTERGTFRILAVGGKASQKADLEYLSRLSP